MQLLRRRPVTVALLLLPSLLRTSSGIRDDDTEEALEPWLGTSPGRAGTAAGGSPEPGGGPPAGLALSQLSGRTEDIATKADDQVSPEVAAVGPRLTFTCKGVLNEAGEASPEWEPFLKRVSRDYEPEEIEAGLSELGLGFDGHHASCQEQPQAVFVLGPNGVGKRTIASELKEKLRIASKDKEGYDAVLLDGDILRHQHKGYTALVAEGKRRRCIVKEAYKLLRPYLFRLKQQLLEEATDKKCRRNLLIPLTCTDYRTCVQNVQLLKAKGYTVSTVGVYAPEKDVRARGLERAEKTGEPYLTEKFVQAFVAFLPVFSVANGRCVLVDNGVPPPRVKKNVTCLGQATFDFKQFHVTKEIRFMAALVIAGSTVKLERFRQAAKNMGFPVGDVDPQAWGLGGEASQPSVSTTTVPEPVEPAVAQARGSYSRELAREYERHAQAKAGAKAPAVSEGPPPEPGPAAEPAAAKEEDESDSAPLVKPLFHDDRDNSSKKNWGNSSKRSNGTQNGTKNGTRNGTRNYQQHGGAGPSCRGGLLSFLLALPLLVGRSL